MIYICHERFGDNRHFETIEQAQIDIRSCGPEFSAVTLEMRGPDIFDDRNEFVGYEFTPEVTL